MRLPVFLELVEMKAKTASVLPFVIGLTYSWFHYQQIQLVYTLLFFIAMFIFNMAVDILDNYHDYHRATLEHNYKEKTNIIGREQLSLTLVRNIMISFIIISASIGLLLASFVGWPLLLMGSFCYIIGIGYSSGPKPLSSLPLGEFFSGFTMGGMIPLIVIYINAYPLFSWQPIKLLSILCITAPLALWIANLMLANNLCDLEEDVINKRYTLVYYLGKKNSLYLFLAMNMIALVAIIIAVCNHWLPWETLLTLLTIPFIYQQTRKLFNQQIKSKTFICAVRILAVGAASYALSFIIGTMI